MRTHRRTTREDRYADMEPTCEDSPRSLADEVKADHGTLTYQINALTGRGRRRPD
ncbi:MAG: hypothetical protein IT429_22690 [Gemmataceae bacterium]|nr:hypothetical protein [Gemmataceae bacterium]